MCQRSMATIEFPSGRQFVLLLALCVVVFGFRLGSYGLSYTEGHRVIPAWEMLESGDWSSPRMFGALYLRKPPGFSWAVAASSLVFGQTEFAARLVGAASGATMVLATWWFGTRWFGSPWGFLAGLVQLSTPLFWRFARSAEIDGLNNALTQIAVYLTLDLCIRSPARSRRVVVLLAVGLGLTIAMLIAVKGPASLPCILAALFAVCVINHDLRMLVSKRVLLAFGIAGIPIAALGGMLATVVARSSEAPILESSTQFDWRAQEWLGVMVLAPQTILHAMPAGLLLFGLLWIRPSQRTRSDKLARSTALAAICALILYMAVGVHNPRYAMPAMTFVPVLAAYAGPFVWRHMRKTSVRRWRAAAWTYGTVSVAAWFALILFVEPKAGNTSGREMANRISEVIPDGADIWADGLIEARPETLLYARSFAADEGRRFDVYWKKEALRSAVLPPAGEYLVLRTDDGEVERYRSRGVLSRLEPLLEESVHRYHFVLFRVRMDERVTDRTSADLLRIAMAVP